MMFCGLKLTHDGAVALIEDQKLVFSIELEKLNNNARYTGIEDTATCATILERQGIDPLNVREFVIDGWGGFDSEAVAIQPRLTIRKNSNLLSVRNYGLPYSLEIAQYQEKDLSEDVLRRYSFAGLKMHDHAYDYQSYLHVTGHILSAYCTSPFAQRREDAYVLIWDGGMFPRLYYFDAQKQKIENLGPLFLLIGNVYTIFSQHFGPFAANVPFAKDDLSIAGKVMAYIALGRQKPELFEVFEKVYRQYFDNSMGFANVFAREFKREIKGLPLTDEDILHSFHAYIEQLLVEKIKKKISRYQRKSFNLCIAGGCALNIKWNSAIRESGIFQEVYVPPFPNDSGSAIGMACASMLHHTGNAALDWNVYSGPELIINDSASGWNQEKCSLKSLARLLWETGEPVVFLNGKAELGPRALGNRSIIADPSSLKIKNLLNQVKNREYYRPVSPICLEERAAAIFEPGIRDPYMLFDHTVKKEWMDKIPGVCHLDGSARLQTVSKEDNPVFHELLLHYEGISGLPLLCNTSANFKNCGFFPDLFSATNWGMVGYTWCDGVLYQKNKQAPISQPSSSAVALSALS